MDGWDGVRADLSIDATASVDAPMQVSGAPSRHRTLLDDLVHAHGTPVSFKCNETICRPSDAPSLIYVISSGWACRYRRLEDGSRQILRILIPGDLSSAVSLSEAGRALTFGIRAVSDVTASVIEAPRLRELIAPSAALRIALFEELCDEIHDLEQRLTDLGVCSAPSRIAQLLLDLHTRLSARGLVEGGAFQFPLRQEDLARAVGLTPVHVNRMLMQLRRLGWISYERGRMHLLNIDSLQKAAAEPTGAFVEGAERTLKPAL